MTELIMTEGPVGTRGGTSIDCPDPAAPADFYRQLRQAKRVRNREPVSGTLRPPTPTSRGPRIAICSAQA